ncbi:MAG: hypothetical protein Q9160_009038 [Pyrenula sp. 1 TL-2023]
MRRNFITIPQRSGLIPNSAGTHAFFLETVYSSETDKDSRGLYVIDLKTSQSKLVSRDAAYRTLKWTGQATLAAWTKLVNGDTEIWIGDLVDGLDLHDTDGYEGDAHRSSAFKAGTISGSYTLVEVCFIRENVLGVLFYGNIDDPNGKSQPSGKELTSLPVQTFDGYVAKPRHSLWLAKVQTPNEPRERASTIDLIDVIREPGLQFDPFAEASVNTPTSVAMSPDAIVYAASPCKPLKPGDRSSTLYSIPVSSLDNASSPLVKAIVTPSHDG